MVLIHSRQGDDTTVEIIKWLHAMGKQTFRINSIDDLDYVQSLIASGEVQSIYYNGLGSQLPDIDNEDDDLKTQLRAFLVNDSSRIWEYMLSKVTSVKCFGNIPFRGNLVNKLKVIDLATQYGFNTPRSEIVNSKARLIELKASWGRIICKAVEDSVNIVTKNVIIHGQRTEEITDTIIQELPDQFFPTLIQELVEKEFEVRSFVSDNHVESIAIFTQSNPETIIDGRRIDDSKPQRQIPYLLRKDIQTKLPSFLKQLSLNYGSFDFIVDTQGEIVFLEVNPFGQYGFLSSASNAYLEKKIAESL